MSIVTKLHTVCMVLQGDKVPESPGDGAIREVREETGLVVRALTYKGLHEFVNQEKAERYVIFNNITESVDGSLLEAPPEGALQWVPIGEVANLPMLPSFKRRFPFFFEPGTFEIHTKWDENGFEETILRM